MVTIAKAWSRAAITGATTAVLLLMALALPIAGPQTARADEAVTADVFMKNAQRTLAPRAVPYDRFLALMRRIAALPAFKSRAEAEAQVTPLVGELKNLRMNSVVTGMYARQALIAAGNRAFAQEAADFTKKAGGTQKAFSAVLADPAIPERFASAAAAAAAMKSAHAADTALMRKAAARLLQIASLKKAALDQPHRDFAALDAAADALNVLFGVVSARADEVEGFDYSCDPNDIRYDPLDQRCRNNTDSPSQRAMSGGLLEAFVGFVNKTIQDWQRGQPNPPSGPPPKSRAERCRDRAQSKIDRCLGRAKNVWDAAVCHAQHAVDFAACGL